MANTVITGNIFTDGGVSRKVTGLTDGVIFQVPVREDVTVKAIMKSAGTAHLKADNDKAIPTAFTEFAPILADQTDSFIRTSVNGGMRWIGVDIDSGTWDVVISKKI